MRLLTVLSVFFVIHQIESREILNSLLEVDSGVRGNERRYSVKRIRFSSSTQERRTAVTKYEPSDSVINGDIHTKKKKSKPWKEWKLSLSKNLYKRPMVEFVDLPPRYDQMAGLISYAAREPVKTANHSHILSIAAAFMLIVVLVVCLHAPCTCLMRKRHKNDLEVDLIGCPNPTAKKGRCGKCIFDRASKSYANRYRVTKSTYASSSATKEELFLSPDYQPPWMTDSSKGPSCTGLPKPQKSKSIVQAILKRSRDRDKFRYEFLAAKYGYNYQQFNDSRKRSSIYDEEDPNWYSAGEFLNNQSNFRGQKTYGSTDFSNINDNSYCQWSRDSRGSRDSGKSTNQSVEDIIKLNPRRRQVLELHEFPIGYSQSCAGTVSNDKENELFDPIRDAGHYCKHRNEHGSFALSESNLDMYFSRMDKKSHTTHSAADNAKSGKRKEKARPTSPKAAAKIVQFYPTSFDYNTKFVQNGGKSKSVGKDKEWHVESDFDVDVSSDEIISFDEEDEFQMKHDFLYSPHMQGYRKCHHYYRDYPALLRYPEVPRYTTCPPKEYKTRMRRNVARSESELRRAGMFVNRMPQHDHSRRGNHVSSSETSLDRMQIENELASVGLVKPKRKQTEDPKMTVRDNRLEPLAGIMSPIRPLKNPTQKSRASDSVQARRMDQCDQILVPNTMMKKCMSEGQSYVVHLPSLEPSSNEDVDSRTKQPQEEMSISIKGTKREQLDSNYNKSSLEFDPHYIKNNYLRDEPVRDIDSDDASENIASYLPSHCRVDAGNEETKPSLQPEAPHYKENEKH